MNTKEIIDKLYKLQNDMPDLIVKKIKCGVFKYVYVISIETVTSSDRVNDFILKYFSNKSLFKNISSLKEDIKDNIPSINFKDVKDEEALLNFIFNGFTVVIYKDEAIAYETRAELDRGVVESSSEPVVRGPKDSFTENYQKNIGLIRRRLKNENVVLSEVDAGTYTKNKVGILYISDICEESLINEVKNSLSNIKMDGIIDVNNLKEYLDKKNRTLFPTLLYTERPDDACRYLLEGRVIVTMDTSPSVIVCPTFFIDFFQNSEDYYHKPFFASFMRIIRLAAFFLSIITPALFIAIINYDPEVLPVSLLINFAQQRNSVPFPAIIEAFLLMFTFELLYEGDSRTPTTRGTSLSVLGALVLGDAAVQAGLISPIMVIVVSVSAISSLIFIYHDIQGSIRFYRYFLMIISALFGIIGFIIGIQFLLLDLTSIKSFGRPYTIPTAPLYPKESSDGLLKRSLKKLKHRPPYITRKKIVRENNLWKR